MQLYLNRANSRCAVEVDSNPRYLRMLCYTGRGVDVVNMTEEQLSKQGYAPHVTPNGPLRYALTFARSELSKSESAAKFIEQIKHQEIPRLSREELLVEYVRLTGLRLSKFKTKAEGVRKLLLASELKNLSTDKESPAMPTDTTQPAPTTLGRDLAAATTSKTNGAKKPAASAKAPAKKPAASAKAPAKKPAASAKAPAKKPAASVKAPVDKSDPLARAKAVAKMTDGSGGMIVDLLKEGKLDHESIVSAVLKKFPDRKVSTTQVAWYKSQLVKAGVMKK